MRIKFEKGQQRKFIDKVISKTNSPSLRGLMQFGLNVKYSALKNYHSELRQLPESLFLDFCKISGQNSSSFKVQMLKDNWGKVKGGKS